MYTVSLAQFLAFVEQRQAAESRTQRDGLSSREKVLRPDQLMTTQKPRERHLATCPECDAVVDDEIIHPRSGLCPLCHEEAFRRF